MSATRLTALALGGSAILALGGCGGGAALGFGKSAPDEFRVVTKAPLVVPPDYALRPPAPGQPRPQELQPESSARQALLGEREKAERTQGESLLAAKAGADKADPLIRYVVDDEFGELAHKDKSFADTVMFWKKRAPPSQQQVAAAAMATPAPLDPVQEEQKVKALTGGKTVVIERAPQRRVIKLPGL